MRIIAICCLLLGSAAPLTAQSNEAEQAQVVALEALSTRALPQDRSLPLDTAKSSLGGRPSHAATLARKFKSEIALRSASAAKAVSVSEPKVTGTTARVDVFVHEQIENRGYIRTMMYRVDLKKAGGEWVYQNHITIRGNFID